MLSARLFLSRQVPRGRHVRQKAGPYPKFPRPTQQEGGIATICLSVHAAPMLRILLSIHRADAKVGKQAARAVSMLHMMMVVPWCNIGRHHRTIIISVSVPPRCVAVASTLLAKGRLLCAHTKQKMALDSM